MRPAIRLPFRPRPASILALLTLFAITPSAIAQVTAAISGKIEDPAGAGIAGVAVTVKNLETGATRSVTTGDAGDFRAASLPIGPYQVRAEKTGFKTEVRNGVNLAVGAGCGGEPAPRDRRSRPGSDRHRRNPGGQYHHLLGFRTGGRARSEGPAAQRPQLR